MRWFFSWQRARTQGAQSPAITKSGPGDVNVLYGLTQTDEIADAIARRLMVHAAAPGLPGAERSVAQAVGNIAAGAEAGDARLRQALELLAADKAAQAEPLLQAFAEAKAAQIARDRKDAATAYRNLGAIAGLRDSKRALEAYTKAVELDPGDLHSQLWAAWLAAERGDLTPAEGRLHCIQAAGPDDGWLLLWSHLTLGDITVSRGNLPAALGSYQASLGIAERLAKADPDNAGWQRDLAVSHGRVAVVKARQGGRSLALSAFQRGLDIIARLSRQSPDNATLRNDLAWFEGQIAALD